MFAIFSFLPQLLQTSPREGYGFGMSVTQSGLLIASTAAAQLTVALFARRLDRRLGGRRLVIAGCLLDSVALAVLGLLHHDL